MEVFDDIFRNLSQQCRALRHVPGAPYPDLEKIVKEASSQSLGQVRSRDAASEAGEAAAKAYFSGSPRKPGRAAADDEDSPKVVRKRKRGNRNSAAKRKRDADRAEKHAKGKGGPASKKKKKQDRTSLDSSDDSSDSDSESLKGASTPSKNKITPLPDGPLKKDSIVEMLDKEGGGLVEMIQRKYLTDNPSTELGALPCGWHTATGKCGTDKCSRCAGGAKLNKEQAKFLAKGMRADLVARVKKADGPFANLVG